MGFETICCLTPLFESLLLNKIKKNGYVGRKFRKIKIKLENFKKTYDGIDFIPSCPPPPPPPRALARTFLTWEKHPGKHMHKVSL